MRILLIHTKYTNAGGEDIVLEQEKKLLSERYDTELLVFQNNKGFTGFLQFASSIWNIRSSYIVKRKIKEFKPDIIHLHNWHFASGPLIIRTIAKLKIPLVFTLHNFRLLCPSATLMYQNKPFLESLQGNFPWKAIRLGVYRGSISQTFWLAVIIWFHNKIKTWDKINAYVFLNDFAVKIFEDSNFQIKKEKIFVKPNFTNSLIKLNSFKRESYYFFGGRLSEEKGVRLLLACFKTLPFELKIAGDGDLRSLVEQTAKERSNISYLGKLKMQHVAIHLQKAKAVIMPSNCHEVFGLIIIEAFSNGCPVIASKIGAPSSLVADGENGFHFEPGSIKDLNSVVKKMNGLKEEEFLKMQKSAYKSYKSLYTPNIQYAYFENIYTQAIKINNQRNIN